LRKPVNVEHYWVILKESKNQKSKDKEREINKKERIILIFHIKKISASFIPSVTLHVK
jgi:hypothetical protein